MSIAFVAADTDRIDFGTIETTGDHTYLIVVKFTGADSGEWASFMESDHQTLGTRSAIGRHTNGELYYAATPGNDDAITFQDGDGWCIIAGSKAAGTSAPTLHKFPVGGARTSATLGSLGANTTSGTGAFRIGGNDDPANMIVAAAAFFNSILTTGNIDALGAALTTQAILDLSPAWCVDAANDNLREDLVGSNNGTNSGSPAVSGDDPAGWEYFGAAADIDVTNVGGIARPTMQVVCREPIWLP